MCVLAGGLGAVGGRDGVAGLLTAVGWVERGDGVVDDGCDRDGAGSAAGAVEWCAGVGVRR